jgi:hopanoid biosynthesis associated RND transporter like protein HpnN
MLRSFVARIVDFSTRLRWPVIAVALLLAVVAGVYAARHFAIDTDVNHLIAPDLDWRQNEQAYDKAFPQRAELILVVIQAPTPETAKQAAVALTERLKQRSDVLKSVRQSGGGEFFEKNGLLYLPTEDIRRNLGQLNQGQALLSTLASDPTLRGLTDAIAFGTLGVQGGQIKLDSMARPLNLASDVLEPVLAGKRAHFSWRVLTKGGPADTQELRRFIEVHPILDFSALEPGRKATEAIRKAVADLDLAANYDAKVRLTGPVPLSDEEFATLRKSAPKDVIVTLIAVIVILWLALHSARLIVACFISLIVGLALTAAIGLVMVGALNLISVAFAVLFIGLGVDFGIQFSVRYRAQRYEHDDIQGALHDTGRNIGAQLTLAAAAVAAGFFSFTPTDYRGLSELGLIAGAGMVIAFFTSVTLLPALISLFNPPGEPHPLGYRFLAPVDRFMERHRIAIVVITLGVALAGSPLLYFMRFDFNVLNMRSPEVESVGTYLELKRDANTGINSIHVLKPSLEKANEAAARLKKLPEVARAMTLSDVVPDGQDEKLPIIRQAAQALGDALNPPELRPVPTDAENIRALNLTAADLNKAANEEKGPGATAARRMAALLTQLAGADPAARERAHKAFVPPLNTALDEFRNGLKAERVTLASLPADFVRDWKTDDGRYLVEVTPRGDPNDNEVQRKFVDAVLALDPTASGSSVSLQESGRTVVRAFWQAGLWALISIAVLLWIVLRRFGDVLLTLVPLLLAGVVTLEICVLIGLPLNFANIIALPLLLGVGVAFKIYYVMAWRAGETSLLQSSLTRAVFFSAMTTATAFGSLSISSHPGMASMGKLLVLSLMCTVAAAVLFQPALMGPPREKKKARRG